MQLLNLRRKQAESGEAADRHEVLTTMRHWQADAGLAALRDAAALVTLPAEEQKAALQLWADVAALLAKAEGGRKDAAPAARKTE